MAPLYFYIQNQNLCLHNKINMNENICLKLLAQGRLKVHFDFRVDDFRPGL